MIKYIIWKTRIVNNENSSFPHDITAFYYYLCSGVYLCLFYLSGANTVQLCKSLPISTVSDFTLVDENWPQRDSGNQQTP